MAHYLRGDIFAVSEERSCQLAIVFGHIGLNHMSLMWKEFSQSVPSIAQIRDPFSELSGRAFQHAVGRWLWFVAENDNHGMTDSQLKDALDSALSWAQANCIKTVITNGVSDVDHGCDSNANRRSDDRRVEMIKKYACEREIDTGMEITLISLNDAFTRPSQ